MFQDHNLTLRAEIKTMHPYEWGILVSALDFTRYSTVPIAHIALLLWRFLWMDQRRKVTTADVVAVIYRQNCPVRADCRSLPRIFADFSVPIRTR